MRNIVIMLTLGAFLLVSAVFIPVIAEAQPPGLEKQEKIPPGFTKGKKTGWEGENPPGWDQMGEQERHKWHQRVSEGRKNIEKKAMERGMTEEEAALAADEYERAVRKGEDLENTESMMKEKIQKGKKWEDASDSISEEQEKLRGKKSGGPDMKRGGDSSRGKGKN